MNYSQNFIFPVAVLGPKDSNWPTVVVGGFYKKTYVLGALTSCIGMTHGEKLIRNPSEGSLRKAMQGLFLNQHGRQQSMLVLSHENKTIHCTLQS